MTAPWEVNWIFRQSLAPGGQGTTSLVGLRSDETKLGVLKELRDGRSAEARTRMFQEVANLRVVHSDGAKVPRFIEGNTDSYEDLAVPLYFVMEHVVGPTLAEHIGKAWPLPLETAVRLTLDIANSIEVGHAKNILHRDLKPENVIIRGLDPPDAVILDYGLSFNLDESRNITSASETMGNKFLVLSEGRVPGDNRRDPRSDLTALCGILYYCLTGNYPGMLQDSAGNAPHRRPKYGLRDDLVKGLTGNRLMSFFDRGFSPVTTSRFQSVKELKSRLDELLAQDSPEAFEDPLEVARQASEDLLKNNRASQLNQFQRKLMESWNLIGGFVHQMRGNLGQFSLDMASSYPSSIAIAPASEMLNFHLIWSLTAEAVGTHAFVAWAVCASGEECTLYRGIYTIKAQPPSTAKTVAAPSPVCRWQGSRGPDRDALADAFKRTLSEAIRAYAKELETSR
ncbi:MAG TPA: protein kinase [Verrucomicrobiae bacterium]|nr:protein kinase [Verrucomicrobiae bacterium]